MPTEHFETYEEAEAFAADMLGAIIARDPVTRKGWIVVWPG
jgi:hypothetical protein